MNEDRRNQARQRGGNVTASTGTEAAGRAERCRYFEDFTLGERYELPSRTITSAHFAAFQALSGDNHPIHYDVEYCRKKGHPEMLAHGYQVVALTAAGAGQFPHQVGSALIAFIDQSSRFLNPLYAGDTAYPTLTVSALEPQRTTGLVTLTSHITNQHGTPILRGHQTYLLHRQTPAT